MPLNATVVILLILTMDLTARAMTRYIQTLLLIAYYRCLQYMDTAHAHYAQWRRPVAQDNAKWVSEKNTQ